MDFSLFFEKCNQALPNNTPVVDAFYKTVQEVLGDCEPEQLSEPMKIIQLLYGQTETLGKAKYYSRLKLVRMLYEWLEEQGLVSDAVLQYVNGLKFQDVVSEYELMKYYFSSLEDVISYITFVGAQKGLGDQDDLLHIKTIAILAWYGLDSEQILSMTKIGISRMDNRIRVGDDIIHIQDAEHMTILRRFASLDMHRGFPSQKSQTYVSTPYLMRTERQPTMNLNSLRCIIHRFNVEAKKYGKQISVLHLRKNGWFYQMIHSDGRKSDHAMIVELAGCDAALACSYRCCYDRWKKLISRGD